MPDLELDPEVLEDTAKIIEDYCVFQKQIMEDYLHEVWNLSSDWNDEKTLGSILEEINLLKQNVEEVMQEIRNTYPSFFRKKAAEIRAIKSFR